MRSTGSWFRTPERPAACRALSVGHSGCRSHCRNPWAATGLPRPKGSRAGWKEHWEAETRRLLDEFDKTTAALVLTDAASTFDVAARIVERSKKTGVPIERMAEIVRAIRRAIGLEIEGDDGAICAALRMPPVAPVDRRRRGRPRKAGFTARVVALERLIRAHGGGTRVHRHAALIFEYFGALALDWMRDELSPFAPHIAQNWAPAAPVPAPAADDLLDVEQTAALTRRSVSWLHHHGHTLPGFWQPQGKGGRKFWSRRALTDSFTNGQGAC